MTTTENIYCAAWAAVLLLIAYFFINGTLLK